MPDDPDLLPFTPPEAPGVRALFGNVIETFPRSLYEEPGLRRFRTPFSDAVFVTDPDLIQEILFTRIDEFVRDEPSRRLLTPFLGERSLILAEGADWRWLRRALSPAFRHELLMSFTPQVARAAQSQVERWRREPAGQPVNVSRAMNRTSLEVITQTLFGAKGALDQKAYLEAVNALVASLPWVTLMAVMKAPAWAPYPGRRRAKAVGEYFLRQVEAAGDDRRANSASSPALFDVMARALDAEGGRAMTPAELASSLVTMLNAGHETAAAALGWTLWLLATHPQAQDRVAEEVSGAMGDAPIAPARLYDLAYTRQVVQEAMRLYPPAPMITRQPKQRLRLGGEDLTPSTQISIATWALHRNRRLWERPNGFDPGHFETDRARQRHRYAYLAFGAGPRTCIGSGVATIELLTVLATLVRAFRFRQAPGPAPYPIARVSLRTRGGMRLLIEPR